MFNIIYQCFRCKRSVFAEMGYERSTGRMQERFAANVIILIHLPAELTASDLRPTSVHSIILRII